MIYLSTVDYAIPAPELTHLLCGLRDRLVPAGEIVCLSASLLEEETFFGSLVNSLKILLRGILHCLGVRRQQFRGWRRTRMEYRQLFRKTGFEDTCAV